MAISSAQVTECAAGLLERLRREAEERERRAAGLLEKVRRATAFLVTDRGAMRVWLFGSLAWGEMEDHSDVDVLVEGLSSDAWDEASAILEECIGVPVDLVRAEEADPGLAERVRRGGVVLHERA
jgi:predicted nucleotidyltransferase